jgi:hypothetical protein
MSFQRCINVISYKITNQVQIEKIIIQYYASFIQLNNVTWKRRLCYVPLSSIFLSLSALFTQNTVYRNHAKSGVTDPVNHSLKPCALYTMHITT